MNEGRKKNYQTKKKIRTFREKETYKYFEIVEVANIEKGRAERKKF